VPHPYDELVTETLRPVRVDLFDVDRLRLREISAPRLSAEDMAARDRAWDKAVQANPGLFDGPAVACVGMRWERPRSLVMSWTRITYRHYALRLVPGNSSWLPSLFVNVVLPTDDGRVVAARMSSSTAAPGRWQLPGGSVEPPQEHDALDVLAVRRHAARELAEETGVELPPEELRLWAVTRGQHGSIGLVFQAPPRPAALLQECFEAVTAAERASGGDPELDRIAVVRSAADLADLDGPHADYLEPVVCRYVRELCGATTD
jgi:8-oxo-dGTP pyrophosphatase MutT (NUDIX family)